MAAASHPWQLSLAWSLFPRTSRGRRRRKHPFASRLLFMVPDVSSAYRLMGLISQSRSKLTHQSMSPALPLSHLALAGTRSLSRIFFSFSLGHSRFSSSILRIPAGGSHSSHSVCETKRRDGRRSSIALGKKVIKNLTVTQNLPEGPPSLQQSINQVCIEWP